MFLFPIGFFCAYSVGAGKRIAAEQRKENAVFLGMESGWRTNVSFDFIEPSARPQFSPERCIIAPFILKGFGCCGVPAHPEPSVQESPQLLADGTRFSKVPSPDCLSVLPGRQENFPAFRHACKDDVHAPYGSVPVSGVQESFLCAGSSAASVLLWLFRCGDRQDWFSVGSWHHTPISNINYLCGLNSSEFVNGLVAHIYYVLWNSVIDSRVELEHIIIFNMICFINKFLNYYIHVPSNENEPIDL